MHAEAPQPLEEDLSVAEDVVRGTGARHGVEIADLAVDGAGKFRVAQADEQHDMTRGESRHISIISSAVTVSTKSVNSTISERRLKALRLQR